MEHTPATTTCTCINQSETHHGMYFFLCFTYPPISSATLIDLSEWEKKEMASEISRKHVKNVPMIEKSVFNAQLFSSFRGGEASVVMCV